MTLHHLRIFLSVAQLKSFTQAAAELNMSQPDVSVHIRNLEQQIGMELFERVGKKIRLSPAGEILKERANLIFAQLQETEQALAELKGVARGSLVIGASTTVGMYLLSKTISEFGRRFPGIKTHLQMGNSGGIEQMVLRMEVDIGFTVGIPIREVKTETFMNDEFVLILPPSHPLSARKKVVVADLYQETFVLRGPLSASWRVFERLFNNQKIRPDIKMELDSIQAVKWAVTEGFGIALVPKHSVLKEANASLFSMKRIHGAHLPCPINIISHPQRKLSPAAQAFLELLPKRL